MIRSAGIDCGSLLVFSDDWGRHPSSCQYLIRQLLPVHPVCWVNTIGMRPPRLDPATLRRAGEKFRQWLVGSDRKDARSENPRVVAPKMWPWFKRPRDRWLNRLLLTRALRDEIESMPQPVTAIATIPIVADLVGRLPVANWVYYCVDDFSVWPGLDRRTMADMESTLVERVDRLIAVSPSLRDKLSRQRADVPLLTHGIDLEFWRPGKSAAGGPWRRCERPYVVFWGVVDRRMDTRFVISLAEEMPCGTILLVGPQDRADPRLLAPANVLSTGPLPVEQLPALAADADVLVMPYVDQPVTRAMQPLKLKEYLATGKPAVVRDLPATRPWADCVDLAATPGEFTSRVRRRLAGGLPPHQQAARQRLAEETWTEKARTFERFLFP